MTIGRWGRGYFQLSHSSYLNSIVMWSTLTLIISSRLLSYCSLIHTLSILLPFFSSLPSLPSLSPPRYVKHVKDIRISVFESIIRSLSHFKIELHRKFPKTESLRDCKYCPALAHPLYDVTTCIDMIYMIYTGGDMTIDMMSSLV